MQNSFPIKYLLNHSVYVPLFTQRIASPLQKILSVLLIVLLKLINRKNSVKINQKVIHQKCSENRLNVN